MKVGVTPLKVPKHEWNVPVEHVAARAEIARSTAADVRLPYAGAAHAPPAAKPPRRREA